MFKPTLGRLMIPKGFLAATMTVADGGAPGTSLEEQIAAWLLTLEEEEIVHFQYYYDGANFSALFMYTR